MNTRINNALRRGMSAGILGLVLVACYGIKAGAQLAWYNPVRYDGGLAPSISVSGNTVVETHEDFNGGLWFRTGTLRLGWWLDWYLSWDNDNQSFQYDSGLAPSVSISGSNVVEVHEDFDGNLYYQTGFRSGAGIEWFGPVRYERGLAPSVCIDGNSIVEVHNDFTGGLWYRRGYFLGHDENYNSSIYWDNNSQSYWLDQGTHAKVAVSGNNFVEVHQDFSGGLYSSTGLEWDFSLFGYTYNLVYWNPSHRYDGGYVPSVSMNGTTVAEVHNGSAGDMWYRTGTFAGYDITWNNWGWSSWYDSGSYPSVGYNGGLFVEAHQDFSGGLYAQLGRW